MVLKPNNAEFFESRICPILTADPILPASTVPIKAKKFIYPILL